MTAPPSLGKSLSLGLGLASCLMGAGEGEGTNREHTGGNVYGGRYMVVDTWWNSPEVLKAAII